MPAFGPEDLAVVVPTRDRWPILARTLGALGGQTAAGFEAVVVADGADQSPPAQPELARLAAPGAARLRLLQVAHGGPGAARNAGAAATGRPLVLFLGDDMLPDPSLVERHLEAQRRHPEDTSAVLGHAHWHPEVAGTRIARWLDRSGWQFDFATIGGEEAGFGRFYSCNVSLKRRFFLDVGGFDPSFPYYYEDLDFGWRLGQQGMRLWYEPAARAAHLHRYDLEALRRRFRGVAEGEHHMAELHPWFEPFFLGRLRAAVAAPRVGRWWPALAEVVPPPARRARRAALCRADLRFRQQLAPSFAAGWLAAEELAELRCYLGAGYDRHRLQTHQQAVEDERDRAPDEAAFYRTSEGYLYDLTVFAMSGTKAPYLAELRAALPPGASVLDFGCGIGSDGLRLAADGFQVSFADFDNPSTRYLRWRLARRRLDCPVHDLDAGPVPGRFDAAFCFDVIEHVEDPFELLSSLEQRADVVAVNFLEEDPDDTDLHRPLPIPALLDHADRCGLLRYRRYHGRSHLVLYHSPRGGRRRAPLRSTLQRRLGSRAPGRPGWFAFP